MDDTQQQQNQNQVSQPVRENTIVDFSGSNTSSRGSQNSVKTTQNTQPSGQQNTTQSSAQTPFVGTSHPKELEPMPSFGSSTEWMKPIEEKVELEPELEEEGVEAISQTPQISEQEKSLGLKLAKETMPMEKEPQANKKFPMTQAQAKQTAKGFLIMKDTSNPMLWLALLILRQYQMSEKEK